MTYREEILADGVRLILGDCREVLPTLGRFDAVVTDPPYGIGAEMAAHRVSGFKGGGMLARKGVYAAGDWDSATPPDWVFGLIRSISDWQIIFGGNYFPLPPARCWLVWDKKVNGEFADCELAWTNLDKPVRRLEWMWNGMLRKGQEPRNEHPTQKPLGVMQWCLEQLPSGVSSIADPYCGSGTTGIASIKAGLRFVGIEADLLFFDLSRRRIEDALRRPDLFVERPKPAVQESLL